MSGRLSGQFARLRSDRSAEVLLYVAPLLFAANMLTARATADFIPPVALAFWRWGVTFAILLPFCGASLWRLRFAALAEWRDILVLGALGMGVCGAFVYIGAATTTATNIGLIYAAAPVLIVILAHYFYGERLGGGQTLGVGLALVGVAVIICRGDLAVLSGLAFTPGDLWIFAAMIGWAVYSVLLRYRQSRLPPMARFAAICLGGVIVLLPFHLWEATIGGRLPAFDAPTVTAVLFLATVASFGAYQVYGFIQRRLGAARAGLLLYLIPVYNAILAMLLLGESIAPFHAVGALLVLAGLLLSSRRT